MTDRKKTAPVRGLRIALAISVALNLAVVGLVGGTLLRADGLRGPAMPRDPGFGFFHAALTPDNRADLRRRLRTAEPGFAAEPRALRQDVAAIVAALRAEPFVPGALDVAMQAQVARLRTRLDVGQNLLLNYLSDLPALERQAIADRLEAAASRRGGRKGPDRSGD